jgi:hypothetical protein
MNKRSVAVLIIAVFVHQLGHAATSSQITKRDFRASVCNISELTVNYTFDEAYGEPLISSKIKWLAGPNTSADCLTNPTYIYLKIKKSDGSFGYIKLTPEIVASGQTFGSAATESPIWTNLICDSTAKNARCLTESQAKPIYAQLPKIDQFEVVAEASIVQQSTAAASERSRRAKTGDDESTAKFDLDSLLEEAIDNTIAPAERQVTEAQVPEEEPEEEISPEEQARLLALQQQELAEQAKNNVVILINTKLAQYATPASSCESDRAVTNSVSVTGTCRLSFRSEATHQFLCEDDGKSKQIRSVSNADLDFARDIDRIFPLRVSESGWVALILDLNKKLGLTDAGDYKVDRWQFTTTGSRLEDMETLASSLATLKSYCETNS